MRYLVTSALPYANGPIHFGHVIGAYLPADVYVRLLRMQGEEVLYVCGADEHGVAITFGAEAAGVEPSAYVARWRDQMKSTFDALGIAFDRWSGTSISPNHAALSQDFFRGLLANGYLIEQESEQLYSPSQERFLADRFVTGTCPNCGFEEARGDECPRCGSWLDALDLRSPRSKVDGLPLEKRSTRHWYLDLPKLRDAGLGDWVEQHEWKTNVRAFLENLLADTRPRAITRDMDWGVPVPSDVTEGAAGKVLYVWFDAPIGYVSITDEWCREQGGKETWRDWWTSKDTRLVHFIGKDNIPFHAFVFPAMLMGLEDGYVLPWQVPANEFYNLEGRKFSTSGGWTIPLERFFGEYDADTTRFHLLASAPETADSEWTWEGFQSTVNAGLADKIGNLVTRVLRFADKHFDGRLPALSSEHEEELDRILLAECGDLPDPGASIRAFRFRRATEELLALASAGNVFLDRTAPWALRKTDLPRCASVLNTAGEWIAHLARCAAPFMPNKAQLLWSMVGREGAVADAAWPQVPAPGGDWRGAREGSTLGEIVSPFAKIEDEAVAREKERLQRQLATQ
ncbi:Methionine--tRNA ligase [Planctomycetes bacterium Pla163]|uniref:Methionine--tRNA ligase n=1 Tax=Rohdeia mirabilis TaxID=2528008 RepID=A0A518CYV6_9BACT|nr:Methionine--tRNA ligase [Planctomycetes bacterium Pla163]